MRRVSPAIHHDRPSRSRHGQVPTRQSRRRHDLLMAMTILHADDSALDPPMGGGAAQ